MACWTRVTEGMGQVVILGGEAGIGKSRLVQVLKEHVASEGHLWLECQGSPYYQHTALYPHRAAGPASAARGARGDRRAEGAAPGGVLGQQGLSPAETVPLFAPLLSLPLPATYAPCTCRPSSSGSRPCTRSWDSCCAWLPSSLLLVMEDLHWVDPSTLEWLSLLVDQGPTARILALCTCRPDFVRRGRGARISPR